MAVNKEELHRMIDKIENPVDLCLAFNAIHSIVERREPFDDMDRWQREEIQKALKQADEGDLASPEEVKRFRETWSYGN